MTRKKKQQNQPTTEAPKAEDPLGSTIVSSATDSISQAPTHLTVGGADAGYIVKCGMCGADIWTSYIDDDLVFICGSCAEELPE